MKKTTLVLALILLINWLSMKVFFRVDLMGAISTPIEDLGKSANELYINILVPFLPIILGLFRWHKRQLLRRSLKK